MNRYFPIAATALSAMTLSAGALAQDAEVTEDATGEAAAPGDAADERPAPAEEPAEETAAAEAPAPAGDAAPAGEAKPDTGPEAYLPRFRWGISFMGGPLAGGYTGGVGGLDLRFGAQMTDMIGIYGQPVLMFGAGAQANAKGASATGLAVTGVDALVDFNFVDTIYVAAGPGLLYGGVGSSSVSQNSASAKASAGAFFSLAARAGVVLGPKKPEKRKGFQLGVDMHVIFAGDVVITPLVALGFETF